MVRIAIISFVLCFALSVRGQILKGFDPNADFNKLVFSEKFIKKNKIKQILAEKSMKKDGDIIRSDGSKEIFTFKQNGQLSSYGLISAPHFQDTLYQLFTFANELLINEKLVNNSVETAELFDYDEKGRITQKEKIKNYVDEDGVQKTTSIANEFISYRDLSDTSWVATYYNNNEKPYKEIEETYNSIGLLKSLKERYYIGNRMLITYYWYNEKAQLKRISKAKKKPENTLFKYDQLGNLIRIEHRKDGKLHYIREFFYSDRTGLLSSSFTRYEGTGLINIEKYEILYH